MDTSTGGPGGGSRKTVLPPTSVSLPLIPSRRASMSGAAISITPSARASSEVIDRLSVTILSTVSIFLFLSWARDRIWAARSLATFRFISSSGASFPEAITGWAAPAFVPGAIAATWAACRIKAPAEAALAPLGETQTATGTEDSRMAPVMALMELTKPPGVSNLKITREAPSFRALSRVSTANFSMAIPTVPSKGAARTKAGPAAGRRSSSAAAMIAAAQCFKVLFILSPP